jgi:hypothetical protein
MQAKTLLKCLNGDMLDYIFSKKKWVIDTLDCLIIMNQILKAKSK